MPAAQQFIYDSWSQLWVVCVAALSHLYVRQHAVFDRSAKAQQRSRAALAEDSRSYVHRCLFLFALPVVCVWAVRSTDSSEAGMTICVWRQRTG